MHWNRLGRSSIWEERSESAGKTSWHIILSDGIKIFLFLKELVWDNIKAMEIADVL
jgi:hypothetical protein